ncbi:hypothetical protein FQN57_001724 [Myotisia sp. PD_48]|nr:hypothetical protein FQN57_001724 [Myotisia sp. PD_48]
MFVFRKDALPKDPVFPANLKQLGYFVNENDQIRMIADPNERFLYKINANDRYNEMQKEAMNTCIRQIVLSRLQNLGLSSFNLPVGTANSSPHVPILISPSIYTDQRVIVVLGEPVQDLGIWSYRTVSEDGINVGSAVNFAAAALRQGFRTNGDDDSNTPAVNSVEEPSQPSRGLILTNPGQLVWYCGGERAISLPTWLALPRKYAVEPPMKMGFQNKIPGSETWQNHITYVFDEVLATLKSRETKIEIIGISEGGLAAVRYLSEHWQSWQKHISSMVLINPLHDINHLHPVEFAQFISRRCRAYLISDKESNLIIPGRYGFGCNCYSSGESQNVEGIMPRIAGSVLQYLDTMDANPKLEEKELLTVEPGLEEGVDKITETAADGVVNKN